MSNRPSFTSWATTAVDLLLVGYNALADDELQALVERLNELRLRKLAAGCVS